MNSGSLQAQLAAGLAELGIAASEDVRRRLLDYLTLLAKWNRVYNLTAVRESADMIPRHLLDSLSVLPYLRGPRVLDIGSGAGLPGLPLALLRPELEFVLLDAIGKKTRFLTLAAAALGLGNVRVVQGRVEAFRPQARFDTLIARAFASIPDMLRMSWHLAAPGGRFLAMKGTYPGEELAALPPGFAVVQVVPLRVPQLAAARHLVIIEGG